MVRGATDEQQEEIKDLVNTGRLFLIAQDYNESSKVDYLIAHIVPQLLLLVKNEQKAAKEDHYHLHTVSKMR